MDIYNVENNNAGNDNIMENILWQSMAMNYIAILFN